jgi:hypothetical protein
VQNKWLKVGLLFSDKKIILWNSEQDRTDGSSVGIPPVSRMRKTSEYHSEPFLGREKPSEFRSEPFLGREKSNSVPNQFLMRKNSEFRYEPFSEEKKPRNSVPSHFRKRKNFRIVPNHFRKRKNLGKRRLLLVASLNFISRNSFPFRSELRNGLFRNTRNHTE